MKAKPRRRRKRAPPRRPVGRPPATKMTPRQQKFVAAYMVTFNQTRAAQRAGASESGAGRAGHELMRVPLVKAEIQRRLDDRTRRSGLSVERTLEEIRRLMTSDITDYFDDEGHLLNLKELPEEMRACIASVKMKDGEISEIKLWPKPHAIHLAATHLRLLAELREQRTSLEERIRQMTTEQRRQYAIELLGKARSMLPLQINATEAEYAVVDAGIGGAPDTAEAESGFDGEGGEV